MVNDYRRILMFTINKITVLFLLLVFFLAQDIYGQYIPSKERGDAKYRRKAQMEGNQIRTTVFNYGMTGREGAVPIYEQTPYEWPKNTGQVYLAIAGIVVGAEVIDDHQIANGLHQPHPDVNPNGGILTASCGFQLL